MAIETLSDIVDEILDKLGIYGAHDHSLDENNGTCNCRCCVFSELISRIRVAIDVGRRLNEPKPVEVDARSPKSKKASYPKDSSNSIDLSFVECMAHVRGMQHWSMSELPVQEHKKLYDYIIRNKVRLPFDTDELKEIRKSRKKKRSTSAGTDYRTCLNHECPANWMDGCTSSRYSQCTAMK